MTHYEQTDDGGTWCKHCGKFAHEHHKQKVNYEDGRWGYDYVCEEQK